MSNKTLGIWSEHHMGNMNDPLSCGGLPLGISSGYQGNSPPSHEATSPWSSTSPSDLGDLDSKSSPDFYDVLDCCIIEDVDSPCPELTTLSDVTRNLHQTCFATPVNDRVNIWNQTRSLMSTPEMVALEGNNIYKNSGKVSAFVSSPVSPESMEGLCPQDSCEASRRSSSENDCCSLSSGELVMRSNSCNLEDETLPLFSSMEESLMSPAMSSGVVLSEGQDVSPHLPDVCDWLQDKRCMEGFTVEKTNPACFGMTIIQEDDWENHFEEKMNTINVTLPSEADSLWSFVCDTSNNDSDGLAPPSGEMSAEAGRPSQLNGTFVQLYSNGCLAPTPEEQDSGGNIQTSTPVLNIGNHCSLPSFSGSPFSGSTGSPAVCPPEGRQILQTPKQQLVARLSSAAGKPVKTEIKLVPKPDYSHVKSRIMTRLSHQLATPGSKPANVIQHKASKIHGHTKPSEANRKALTRIATAKLTWTTASIGVPKEDEVKGEMGITFLQSEEEDMSAANPYQPCLLREDVVGVSRVSLCNSIGTGNDDASSALNAEPSPRAEQTASGQEVTSTPTPQPANATFCASLSLETPGKNDHVDDPKTSPKKTEVSHRNRFRSGSTSCRDTPPVAKMQSVDSSTSQSRPSREKRRSSSCSSLSLCSSDVRHKAGNLSSRGTPEGTSREVRKISLVAELPKSKVAEASGSTCDQSKSRPGVRRSPRQSKGLPASRTTPESPGTRPESLSRRQRPQGTTGGIPRTTDPLQVKQRNAAAHPRALATDKPTTMGAPTTRTKPAVNGFPSRPSAAGPSHVAVPKTPQKTQGPYRSTPLRAGVQSDRKKDAGSTPVASLRSSSFGSTVVLKTRLLAKPPGDTGQPLAASCKSTSSSKGGPARTTASPPRRTVSSRIGQPVSSLPVDKSKLKTGSRLQQQQQQRQQQPPQSVGGRVPVPPAALRQDEQSKRKDRILQKLRELLAGSNRKFEAMAVVLQHTLAERDEVVRRRRELSQELQNLQGQLVCSTTSCERLEKEKEEVQASLEDALRRLEEQHQQELAQLEARLQAFYQAEWDKVHLTYQEQADKCRALMEQQIGDLKANHEATKLDFKAQHFEHLQDVKRQYEDSLKELHTVHSGDLQSLQDSLKESEATLSGQIQELREENDSLVEKLQAEEERRKQLAGKSQKDSHTLYLEQELESLNVVLDIKNKQLHQQEKKLVHMDTVVDKSVKLDDDRKKFQQENEDLKARMAKHAALSRQLSTEQAVLHESLQKESKVNKRLSMENEELQWKLHNGELSSPRRLSPTSPTSHSHAGGLQSPRTSALFSSPPVSPR